MFSPCPPVGGCACGVAREEHPADAEALGQPDVRPPHGRPHEPAQPHARVERVEPALQGVQRRLGVLLGQGRGELEQPVRTRQRAEVDAGHRVVGAGEPVAVLVVEAVRRHVPEQHPDRVVRRALERDAQRLADDAASSVGAHQVGGPHGLAGGQARRHPVRVLVEADQLGGRLPRAPELGQPVAEYGLGPGLPQDPRVRIGHIRRRPEGLGHPPLHHELPVEMDVRHRQRPSLVEHRVEDAEIFEDLERARLQPVAPRTGEELGRLVDDAYVTSAPGQVDGQGQAGRSGSRDEHIHN